MQSTVLALSAVPLNTILSRAALGYGHSRLVRSSRALNCQPVSGGELGAAQTLGISVAARARRSHLSLRGQAPWAHWPPRLVSWALGSRESCLRPPSFCLVALFRGKPRAGEQQARMAAMPP